MQEKLKKINCILASSIMRNASHPTEVLISNARTIQAMKTARKGKLVKVDKIDNLLAKLNEDG